MCETASSGALGVWVRAVSALNGSDAMAAMANALKAEDMDSGPYWMVASV
jgi:hypothetical protein